MEFGLKACESGFKFSYTFAHSQSTLNEMGMLMLCQPAAGPLVLQFQGLFMAKYIGYLWNVYKSDKYLYLALVEGCHRKTIQSCGQVGMEAATFR